MNTTLSKQLFLFFTAICLVSAPLRAEIRVGLSQVDITPPIGGLTTGYSSAKPTDGIHDPVSARVLVLESDQACVALAVCDLCVYNSAWLYDQMAAIGVDQLLLLNTHTHAGPKLSQNDFPSADKPWRDTVDQRLLAAIKQAKQNMFRGYFAASSTQIQYRALSQVRLVRRISAIVGILIKKSSSASPPCCLIIKSPSSRCQVNHFTTSNLSSEAKPM